MKSSIFEDVTERKEPRIQVDLEDLPGRILNRDDREFECQRVIDLSKSGMSVMLKDHASAGESYWLEVAKQKIKMKVVYSIVLPDMVGFYRTGFKVVDQNTNLILIFNP